MAYSSGRVHQRGAFVDEKSSTAENEAPWLLGFCVQTIILSASVGG